MLEFYLIKITEINKSDNKTRYIFLEISKQFEDC